MNSSEIRNLLSWLGAVLGIVCLACLLVSFAFGPEGVAAGEHLEALRIPAEPCDGCGFCGMSRGFALFSAGRFGEGMDLNPGVVALYPAFWLLGVCGPAYAMYHALRRAR